MLISPAEGLGLRRADPALRRFTSFASFIIEPGDPAVYMPGLLRRPPTYANLKKGKGTHSLIITTMGVNHAFSGANPKLTLIDGGHWLAVLIVMGAVIGAFGG